MKLATLVSGGKDSLYAAWLAKERRHKIKYLIGIESENPNSYMYHVPNINLVKKISEVMNLPIKYTVTKGKKEEELKKLREVLKSVKEEICGVVSGALASNYQRSRIEKICEELRLESLTPLWGIDEEEYMEDLIQNNFEVIITSAAAQGLDKSWLGREINRKSLEELKRLKEKYKIHLAGEGGEYESLVLDCPLYEKRLEIVDSEIEWDEKTSSGKLKIKKVKMKKKF